MLFKPVESCSEIFVHFGVECFHLFQSLSRFRSPGSFTIVQIPLIAVGHHTFIAGPNSNRLFVTKQLLHNPSISNYHANPSLYPASNFGITRNLSDLLF